MGAGAAFVSDMIFFSTIKDGKINSDELRFMKLGGKVVWFGLLILVLSGILLFSTDPQYYLASTKFLAKLSIVAVIIINGIIFHFIHFPHIHGHLGLPFRDSPSFIKRIPVLMISGGVSVTSWIFAVVLGVLSKVSFSYSEIMLFYLFILVIIVTGALMMRNYIFQIKKD